MQEIVNIIRTTLTSVKPDASFIHGRSFDSALGTHIKSTEVAYVFLNPLQKTGSISDGSEKYNVEIGFIKQDTPDSSVEEMEEIVYRMDMLAIDFLTKLFDVNILDDGAIVYFEEYNMLPIYRIKNVCSGVLYTFQLTSKRSC